MNALKKDVFPTEVLRHGAYVCVRAPANEDGRRALCNLAVDTLATGLELQNEFETTGGHPSHAVAFIRRVGVTPGSIPDLHLEAAEAIVHVACPEAAAVDEFCQQLKRLIGSAAELYLLKGVVRPTNYTGNTMHNFAYAHQLTQCSGREMPNAFLLPTNKTQEWWKKDWMERSTYFLPRYDEQGRMLNEGHTLAAAPGIECLMRRTYKNQAMPATEGRYDFLNYFECADAGVAAFHTVCAALRDERKNPEWKFVREGPTWHGRRVSNWQELFGDNPKGEISQ